MKPTRFKVGTYQLGFKHVDLFVDTTTMGGKANWALGDDEKNINPWIDVGINCALWYAYGTLLHETMEVALNDLGLAWAPKNTFSPNQTDGFLFVMQHKQFDNATQFAGSFICDCRKDFEKAYVKYSKKK